MKIYIDLNLDFEECIGSLKKELIMLNQGNEFNNVAAKTEVKQIYQVDTEFKPNIKLTGISCELLKNNNNKENHVYSWSKEDVYNWFNDRKIDSSIKESLTPCDGKMMAELYKISQDNSDFFLSTLYSDSKARLKDIVFFRIELKSLFCIN